MKESGKKRIVIHNDHGYVAEAAGEDGPAKLTEAIRPFLESGADIISVCAATQEGICWYFPTRVGQVLGNTPSVLTPMAVAMRGLVAADVDPFKKVVDEVKGHGLTMLAKLRPNDGHHVTQHPEFAGWFWLKHPEWRIGVVEKAAGGPPSFDYPCVGPVQHSCIDSELRPYLLDYAVPEVRENRLSLVREFIERYDVAGLTLNFLRGPHCVSFPSRNAHHLTTFVAECRRIVVEAVGKRGKTSPIVGAIVPWDIDFCRVGGMDVDAWIQDGLLDYVSPTETYVTDFNIGHRTLGQVGLLYELCRIPWNHRTYLLPERPLPPGGVWPERKGTGKLPSDEREHSCPSPRVLRRGGRRRVVLQLLPFRV